MCPHFILSDNGTEFKNQWSRQLGQIHQPSISQLLCNTAPCNCWNTLSSLWKRSSFTMPPISESHAGIPGLSWIWISRPQITLPCNCHSQKDFGWRIDLNMHKGQQTSAHLILMFVTAYTLITSNLANGPKMESWLQDCSYRVQWTLPPYRKPSYRKNLDPAMSRMLYMNCLMECWHKVWQSWKIYKFSSRSPNYPLNAD